MGRVVSGSSCQSDGVNRAHQIRVGQFWVREACRHLGITTSQEDQVM